MGQHIKEKWVRAESVSNGRINILWSVGREEEGVNSLRPDWQQRLGHYRLHHRRSTYYTCVTVRQP